MMRSRNKKQRPNTRCHFAQPEPQKSRIHPYFRHQFKSRPHNWSKKKKIIRWSGSWRCWIRVSTTLPMIWRDNGVKSEKSKTFCLWKRSPSSRDRKGQTNVVLRHDRSRRQARPAAGYRMQICGQPRQRATVTSYGIPCCQCRRYSSAATIAAATSASATFAATTFSSQQSHRQANNDSAGAGNPRQFSPPSHHIEGFLPGLR
ncbi:hypothetical protein GGI42DRAFT_142222 [Trichoderma sp. SZMC 28013]